MNPLLRPNQVEEMSSEKQSLEKKLANPYIQDKGAVVRQLRKLEYQLDSQSPKPPVGKEEDVLRSREKQLLTEITEGMPSQEEMRKNPPGAVDKHRAWEAKNKSKILEWKNIRLRLNCGSSERDLANLERHRPKISTLNMDNAQIPGKAIYLPSTASPSVTFTQEQINVLKELSPELASKLSVMDNEQRGQVKEILTKPEKKKKGMSAEARQRASERMKAMHARKKAMQ